MQSVGVDSKAIKDCVTSSFTTRSESDDIDFDLDENTLLREE